MPLRNLWIGLMLLAVSLSNAQGTLQFNRALINGSTMETVPPGKVWKVTAVYGTAQNCYEIGPCYTALSPTSYAFSKASGIMVNGYQIITW
jgi:hypothetical protein